MPEKFNIEIDSDFAEKFFALGDKKVPDDIKLEDLNEITTIIKNKLDAALSLQSMDRNQSGSETDSVSGQTQAEAPSSQETIIRSKSVLVVDDLGIVTIQLESLFKKLGFEVTVSRELFDAIEKYKTQDFGYAVVDLFIPTEREGFILIDEIKKLSLLCKLNTKIIVMSASNKKEHQDNCLNRGANAYVEKAQGWQKKLADLVLED